MPRAQRQNAEVQEQEVVADGDEVGVDVVAPSRQNRSQEGNQYPADEKAGKSTAILGDELGLRGPAWPN